MEPKNNPNPKPVEGKTEKVQAETGSPLWKNVLVGGVPGILIGAAGMYGYEVHEGNLPPVPPIFPGPGDPDPVDPAPVLQAHSVNDDMTFSEAFAAARAEVGPGGAFVWHGQVFGTYRADDPEWLNMTPEERLEHSEWILSQVHPEPYTPTGPEPPIVPVDPVEPVDPVVPVDPEDPDPGEGSEINLEEVEQYETEDGEIATVGYGTVDGHQAAIADTDGDQLVDTLIVDENDNSDVEANEVYDVSDSGITTDDLLDAAYGGEPGFSEDPHGDIPDYTNDADVNSL